MKKSKGGGVLFLKFLSFCCDYSISTVFEWDVNKF